MLSGKTQIQKDKYMFLIFIVVNKQNVKILWIRHVYL